MFAFTALKLAIGGFFGGFQIPAFLKSPLFWKVAGVIFACWFIWHKATVTADARWQHKLNAKVAELNQLSTNLLNEQRDEDMKRILELETLNDQLKQRARSVIVARKKNSLSDDCNRCRVPRSRSPRRLQK